MGGPGKNLNTYMDLITNRSNNKQKASFVITDITNQDFSKFLKKFKNSPYLIYKNKQVHNEPTEFYLFLIKQISKLIKSDQHNGLYTKGVNLGVKKRNWTHQQNN